MTRMPALFIGHGSPMNTLQRNGYTQAWRSLGEQLPRPRALLVISAHWFIGASAVTAMARPRTIHDFYGFPDELFAFDYPAPGLPEVAEEVAETVKPRWVGLDQGEWGLDHGTWSVLAHLYPDADVPVVQLSINAAETLEYHVDLGARLSPLRDRGVMVIGSGNIVHNLRAIAWDRPDEGFDWAHRFDAAAAAQLAADPAAIARLSEHPDYPRAVPTTDHFIPLLYLAGLATEGNEIEPLVRGYAMGSLSMSCYGLDTKAHLKTEAGGGGSLPAGVPPEQTNM